MGTCLCAGVRTGALRVRTARIVREGACVRTRLSVTQPQGLVPAGLAGA